MPLPEYVSGQKGQGDVPADVSPVIGDEDAPVGITVMGDAQVRPRVHDHLLEGLEVVLGRFAGVARELPLGVPVQGYRPHAEPPHELGGGVARCAVGAVDAYRESRPAYAVRVDSRHNRVDVLVVSSGDLHDPADLVPWDALRSGLVHLLYRMLLLRGAFRSVCGDAFDPVELWRVVGCGDHHSACDLRAASDVVLKRRGRNHPYVQHICAHGHEPCRQGAFDHVR